jgi:hypothetical protein
MGPEFLAEPPKQLAAVRLSNDEASVGSKHVDRSYLVMFREAGAASSLYFSSFSDEYAHHYTNLSEEHLGDPRIKDIDVLTSIDMSGLKSIEWEADFSVPKTMASLFSNFKDESSAGVLARVDFSDNESAADMSGKQPAKFGLQNQMKFRNYPWMDWGSSPRTTQTNNIGINRFKFQKPLQKLQRDFLGR